MARRRRSEIGWAIQSDGYVLGRYQIIILEPLRWQLQVAGRNRSEHSRASEALAMARRTEGLRRRNLSVLRNSLVAVLALATFLVLLPLRLVANDAYPPARAFVERLETLYGSVRSGEITIIQATELDDEFNGAAFTVMSPLDLGGGRVTRDYEMLLGSHGGECYVVHWQPGRGPFFGVLGPATSCEPAEELTQSTLYLRFRSELTPESEIGWDTILPPAEVQAGWFLPMVFGAMILILQGSVGITLALIRYSRAPKLLPDLPTDVVITRLTL